MDNDFLQHLRTDLKKLKTNDEITAYYRAFTIALVGDKTVSPYEKFIFLETVAKFCQFRIIKTKTNFVNNCVNPYYNFLNSVYDL